MSFHKQFTGFCLSLFALLVTIFTAQTTHAATLDVDPFVGTDGGTCIGAPCQTIGYALSQAAAGDTINLAAGTYHDPNDYGLVIDTEVVIRGAGRGLTTINAEGLDRHFTVAAGVPRARVRDLTLTNGLALGNFGGSIWVLAGVDFDLMNVEINNTTGYDGGAIACQLCARMDIDDSIFVGNSAARFGGAIYMSGSTTTVDINRSEFNLNDADSGGAIYKLNGRIIVEDSSFASNNANNGSGGAIYSHTSNLNVGRSLLTANTAALGNGGGIYVVGEGVFKLFNSTLSNNSAAAGGGLSIHDSVEALTASNTFYGNEATFGNSGGAIQSSTSTDFLMTNSIISSSVGADCLITGGLYPRGKHNFLDDATCYNVVPPVNFLLGLAVVGVDIDPVLQNNGGLTETHMLPAGSAAIDQGFNNCPHPFLLIPLSHDQRNQPRSLGVPCDVGAVEVQ